MRTRDSVRSRVNKLNSGQSSRSLSKTILGLHEAGFNVIPVLNKKPLCSWSSEKRLNEEELRSLIEGKSFNGVALIAGSENPLKPNMHLIIVDVDNPRALENREFASVIERTVRWWTGPRCPQCGSKEAEKVGEELHCKSCGSVYKLSEAKRGLGALFWVSKEDVEKYLKGTLRGGDVEILVKNYALIPPSLHPSGILYEWIKEIDLEDHEKFGIHKLTEEELKILLDVIGVREEAVEKEKEEKVEVGCRQLQDTSVMEIVNSLRDAYKPGVRDYIVLYLTGWFRKANVCYESSRKVVELLSENDEEKNQRIYVLDRTYGRRGNPPTPEELKAKSGLLEILEQAIGEERALAVVEKIEEVLGVASPWRDSIYAILDYEKQLYAVANLRKKIIARAKRTDKGFIYKELVVNAVPTRVIVYDNPIGGVRRFEITFESPIRRSPLVVGPATVEEIVARLRAEGLVQHSRLVEDVFNALIKAYIVKSRAEFKEEIESPGFYAVNGRVVSVKYDVRYTTGELLDALVLLDALSEWFKHVIDRFATVIKWGVVAPFSYVYKQAGRWMPWLYLYGSTRTGKTTLGEIVLSLWGLDGRYVKTGTSIDTVPRLGYVLSMSTFPVLVNEPGGALKNEEIVEAMKNAIEKPLARGKFIRGTYTEIPALTPLIFTSNRTLPQDDALLRRLVVLQFTYGERIQEDRAKQFESNIKPQLGKLSAIGKCVAEKVVNGRYALTGVWSEDSVALLTMCYREAGVEPPSWLRAQAETTTTLEDYYESVVEAVRSFLVKRVNEEYNRFVGRVVTEKPEGGVEYLSRTELDLRERILMVLDKNLLPWVILREGEEGKEVVITTAILSELKDSTGDISLKNLAELLGWEYRKVKIGKKTLRVMVARLEDFISFINPK